MSKNRFMKIYIVVSLVAQPVIPATSESEAGSSRVQPVLTTESIQGQPE